MHMVYFDFRWDSKFNIYFILARKARWTEEENQIFIQIFAKYLKQKMTPPNGTIKGKDIAASPNTSPDSHEGKQSPNRKTTFTVNILLGKQIKATHFKSLHRLIWL